MRELPPAIATLVDELRADDPLAAAVAARSLVARLQALQEDLISEAVSSGATWDAVGRALGMSRQAAWERYRSRREETTPPVDLAAARQRQRQALAEARELRRRARAAPEHERAALAAEADRARAAALAALAAAVQDEDEEER